MMDFAKNRPYLTNEFHEAVFDPATGLPAEELKQGMEKLYEELADTPAPILRAKVFAYLLDNARLQINPHTPFAVKMNFGIDYSGFASEDIYQKAIFTPRRRKMLEDKLPEDIAWIRDGVALGMGGVYTDFWHTVPGWEFLLAQGFPGLLNYAKTCKEALTDPERITYLEGVILCFEAIMRNLERIRVYSLNFPVPEFTESIQALMNGAPKTLYQVMQFSVMYLYYEELGVERARTLGCIDRLYQPYYDNDLACGSTEAQLDELFRYYFLHFTATRRYAEEPFTMGGSTAEGEDLSTPLTWKILEIYDELNIYDPKIHLRWHKGTDKKLTRKVLDMIRRGNSSLCLICDETVYRGYERVGIPREDAQKYVILGCYEPIIMGLEEGEIAPCRIPLTKFLEFAMNDGKDLLLEKQMGFSCRVPDTFEEFVGLYLAQLDHYTEQLLESVQRQGLIAKEINPSMLYSAGFPECLERGMDVHEYPLKYNNLSLKFIGLATVVDSLLAIRKLVYEEKTLTMAQLKQILLDNWEGHEALRLRILKDAEKYGNNLTLPDSIMCRITEHLAERYCGRKLPRGGVVRLGLDSVTSCVNAGKRSAATPDGRRAEEPISKNLCAVPGMDRGGITALMGSQLKINHADYVDATVLDFILHPSAVEGEAGLNAFTALTETFFAMGGFALQGNIVSAEILKAAQANPEEYATLQIRVCGWNEYFVKMSRLMQDTFIAQCERT